LTIFLFLSTLEIRSIVDKSANLKINVQENKKQADQNDTAAEVSEEYVDFSHTNESLSISILSRSGLARYSSLLYIHVKIKISLSFLFSILRPIEDRDNLVSHSIDLSIVAEEVEDSKYVSRSRVSFSNIVDDAEVPDDGDIADSYESNVDECYDEDTFESPSLSKLSISVVTDSHIGNKEESKSKNSSLTAGRSPEVSPSVLSPTSMREKVGNMVDELVDILKEPYQEELRVVDEEGDVADDSFASIDIPLITTDNTTVSHVGIFVSVINIQRVFRGFLGREKTKKCRALRRTIREEISKESVSGKLLEVYDRLVEKRTDVLEDSFAR